MSSVSNSTYVQLNESNQPISRSDRCEKWCGRTIVVLSHTTLLAMIAWGVYLAADCGRSTTCSGSQIFASTVLISVPILFVYLPACLGCPPPHNVD